MQKRIYNAVYEEMMVVHELLKPGHTNEELNIAARNVIKKHGFEEWGFHGVLGHSIGVSGLEAPLIGEIAATGGDVFEFKPGMIFSCEPAILVPNVPGGGGVRIEDTILVTEDGNEILSRYPYCDELLG
jgi:Xaa-Pro aminopeptidase